MITFSVSQQILTRTDTDRVIADSQNHVKAKFTLDEEWQGLTVTAVFQNGNVTRALYNVVSGTAVTVPWEVLHPGNMHVYLEGYDGQLRLTTARLDRPVRVHPSGRIPWTSLRNEPSPSLYEQLVAACSELNTRILGKVSMVSGSQNDNVVYGRLQGAETALNFATSSAAANTIARRDASGRIKTGTPNAAGDAANKDYVDSCLAALDTLTVSAVSDAGRPNTTMRFADGIQISYGEVALAVDSAVDLLTLNNGKHLYQLSLSLLTGSTALFAENFLSVGFCRLSYQDESGNTALSLTGSAGNTTLSDLSGVFIRSVGTAVLPGRLYYTVIGRWKA